MSTRDGWIRAPTLPARWRSALLLVPLLVLDVGVFLVPMGYLLRLSFTAQTPDGAFVEGSWATDGYQYVFETGLVHDVFGFTLGFGVLVTALSVAIGTAYAYAAWQATGWTKTVLLSGAVLSLFTTMVVKLFAVVLVFSPRGVVNDLLTGLGVVAEPLLLIDNLTGAVLAQLYIVVPYAILSVYAVLSTLDRGLVEAALDLGATRQRAAREVVLPHARPGIAVAGVVSFTWSVGAYAGPLLLGSGSEQTTGVLISRLLLTRFDWPAAAALSVVTIVVVFAVLLAALWRLGGDGGLLDA
ncbi:ABC transporter permease [Halorientalis pallida]|uniref:ABC transporter permease n=1 Tax=Halorientalis pallida TaxID=2479928 RepID=A0A498KYL6_9EURY|nr:ABC transporter permease [Halorientalis pallida]RXK50439.1 ABC transporter permease [Halorientalis pallida]